MPLQTKRHTGYCDGGPLAGKRLVIQGTRHRISIRPMPAELGDMFDTILGPDAEALPVEAIDGEYVWDEGAWRWKGDNAGAEKSQA